MKKTILLCCVSLLMGAKSFAALVIQFNTSPSSPLVVTANSTTWPGYAEVTLTLGVRSNTGCCGFVTPQVQRRKITNGVAGQWITVNDIFTPGPTNPNSCTYTKYSHVLQPEGTIYEYTVNVTFVPVSGCGIGTETGPNTPFARRVEVLPSAHPCFTLGQGGIPIPSDGSPVTLCKSNNLFINASCSTNETKYYVSVVESNLYWERTYAFEWGKWYFTSAGLINLQAEIINNPGEVTHPNPYPSQSVMNLKGGVLTAAGFEGQYRYYRITLATGEPAWETKVALIRVNESCRTRPIEVVDVIDVSRDNADAVFSLSPNPVKDMLDISLNEGERLKTATVFDFKNNLVRRESFSDGGTQHRIDLSSLEKGLYVIEIQTDQGIKRHKIIKE